MDNPKQSNVVKIGHNSNRSITKETVEKISKRFMHILDVVDNNLRLLEQNYFEACTKYPFRSKFNRHESFKKLLPHHVEDARQEADNALDRLRMDLINEQDTLRHRMKEKYDITVESERQRIDRKFEEDNNENK